MANARAQAADNVKTMMFAIAQAWDECAAQYSAEDQIRKWAHARTQAISMRANAANAYLSVSIRDSATARSILKLAKSQVADILRLNEGSIDPGDRRLAETLDKRFDLYLKGIAEQGDAFTIPRPTPMPTS